MLKAWAGDETRRAKTHVSEAVCFATKPTMARGMIAGRLDEGTPCRCVLADAVYGSDRWMLARRSRHDPGALPATPPSRQQRPRLMNSRQLSVCVGQSINASCGQRASPASIIARPAPGMAGTGKQVW
uniref:transposase n=1 Tax=Roseovarius sp. BRH_c41 TaxID=1629709 RepID=UPI00345B5117